MLFSVINKFKGSNIKEQFSPIMIIHTPLNQYRGSFQKNIYQLNLDPVSSI